MTIASISFRIHQHNSIGWSIINRQFLCLNYPTRLRHQQRKTVCRLALNQGWPFKSLRSHWLADYQFGNTSLNSKQVIHGYLILYHIVIVVVHNAIRRYHDKV